jgi:hypothetical protein
MEEILQIWRVAANILNKQSWTANKEWSSRMRMGQGTNNSLWKKKVVCYKMLKRAANLFRLL